MASVRVLVLRAAGINCDQETAYAWQLAGATADLVHINRLIAQPRLLDHYQVLTIPGGFSYGDNIAAGKILASQIVHYLADQIRQFIQAGKLLLGICNGLQVLVKACLLPGWSQTPQPLTLSYNDSGRFEDRWVHLKVTCHHCVFLPPGQILHLPVAHAEGKVVARDRAVIRRLRREGLVALRYTDARGRPGPYPLNPNGSDDHIAGLTDPTGRILGLMPHPERFVQPTQHPR
ncbi:MAG: phosphoribosylformylglycinamidine synthase I, partial [Phycisphaerae bacterium]